MITLHKGELSYHVSHVIFYGVKYKTPITLQEIQFQFYKNCLIEAIKELNKK